VLIECEFFTLELLSGISGTIELDTAGKSFHAITVIEGKAVLKTNKEEVELEKFQTAVIPAQMGTYQFQPLEDCRALKSSA
jgi:mannose-6-phosphate isomerase